MYHSAFRTAQLMPITNAQTIPTTNTLSLKPLIPLHRRLPFSANFRRVLVVSGGDKRKVLVAKCSAAAAADGAAVLERCFRAESGPKKKGGGKSGSIGTLEKPKVEKKPKQEEKPSPPEVLLCSFIENGDVFCTR